MEKAEYKALLFGRDCNQFATASPVFVLQGQKALKYRIAGLTLSTVIISKCANQVKNSALKIFFYGTKLLKHL